jgi:hypothetical protein
VLFSVVFVRISAPLDVFIVDMSSLQTGLLSCLSCFCSIKPFSDRCPTIALENVVSGWERHMFKLLSTCGAYRRTPWEDQEHQILTICTKPIRMQNFCYGFQQSSSAFYFVDEMIVIAFSTPSLLYTTVACVINQPLSPTRGEQMFTI